MKSTIHFFIPLEVLIPVPDGYPFTRFPSGISGVNTHNPEPTPDGIHFVFHHIAVDAPSHLGVEASLLAASLRTGELPRAAEHLQENRKNFQTVVEAMVELGEQGFSRKSDYAVGRGISSQSLAFDYAIAELNVLLRAISFAQRFPIKSISRESAAPIVSYAFSSVKPWEMIGNGKLPKLKKLGLFKLNLNYPLSGPSGFRVR